MTNRRNFLKTALLPAGAFYLSPKTLSTVPPRQAPAGPSALGNKLRTLTRTTRWTLTDQIKVQFKTFHCQGMVKIGNDFWVSSVETDNKKGHLFKIDNKGNLLADISIGEGALFHPSGIDFDGRHIYIAAAEYRPDSNAILYRFDPATQQLNELFRWQDHIGGIFRNPDTDTLHGISWGSRRFYRWSMDKKDQTKTPNPSFYIDYQDGQYIGNNEAVYTGLSTYKKPDGTRIAVGGIDLIDLEQNRPIHQVPVDLWSPTGTIITQNPSYFELSGETLRAYFMPDDNDSTIFIYEAP